MNIVLGYLEEYFENLTAWLTDDNEFPDWLKKKENKKINIRSTVCESGNVTYMKVL
jgi:hypothetical protein